MKCNECGNDISVVSHKSWCSDYKHIVCEEPEEVCMQHTPMIDLESGLEALLP
jgi:hypothetical protein